MPFKALVLALPLLAIGTAASAAPASQPIEKNGLPCVTEICLGDSLPELSKIQWTPAQTSFKINNKLQATAERKLSDDDIKTLKALFPNSGEAAPFLYEKQFDANALPALSRVTAACDVNELFGTFGSSAAPTKVGISLMPALTEPNRHVWTVTSIVREFPDVSTIEQKASVTLMLKQRYSRFGAGTRELPATKPGDGRFFLGGMSSFGFGLSLVRAPEEDKRLKQHPMCSDSGKVATATSSQR